MDPKFITLEGIDGAGKTTALRWLTGHLRERGIAVCMTREPGGTVMGEQVRDIVLRAEVAMHAETEALLMFAARREHLARVIEPALARGEWVLCDRFTDATFAYQGAGGGVAWAKLAALEAWVQGSQQPDLTILFDLPPAVAALRIARERIADRFESERRSFFERVRQGYLRRAQEASSRIRVIDASGSAELTQQRLEGIVHSLWQ